jgi:hypothetical protein
MQKKIEMEGMNRKKKLCITLKIDFYLLQMQIRLVIK